MVGQDEVFIKALSYSYMENLMNEGYNQVFLARNYRCHPALAMLLSRTIYRNLMEPNMWRMLEEDTLRICDVPMQNGKTPNEVEGDEPDPDRPERNRKGYSNEYEADKVIEEFERALTAGYRIEEISIVSGYWRQVRLLRERMERYFKNKLGTLTFRERYFLERNIRTIDGYQGKENKVVIVSFVRSNPDPSRVGHMGDLNRWNVMISRMIDRLVLVGDLTTLRNASKTKEDENFSNFWNGVEEILNKIGDLKNYEKTQGLYTLREYLQRKNGTLSFSIDTTLPGLEEDVLDKLEGELKNVDPRDNEKIELLDETMEFLETVHEKAFRLIHKGNGRNWELRENEYFIVADKALRLSDAYSQFIGYDQDSAQIIVKWLRDSRGRPIRINLKMTVPPQQSNTEGQSSTFGYRGRDNNIVRTETIDKGELPGHEMLKQNHPYLYSRLQDVITALYYARGLRGSARHSFDQIEYDKFFKDIESQLTQEEKALLYYLLTAHELVENYLEGKVDTADINTEITAELVVLKAIVGMNLRQKVIELAERLDEFDKDRVSRFSNSIMVLRNEAPDLSDMDRVIDRYAGFFRDYSEFRDSILDRDKIKRMYIGLLQEEAKMEVPLLSKISSAQMRIDDNRQRCLVIPLDWLFSVQLDESGLDIRKVTPLAGLDEFFSHLRGKGIINNNVLIRIASPYCESATREIYGNLCFSPERYQIETIYVNERRYIESILSTIKSQVGQDFNPVTDLVIIGREGMLGSLDKGEIKKYKVIGVRDAVHGELSPKVAVLWGGIQGLSDSKEEFNKMLLGIIRDLLDELGVSDEMQAGILGQAQREGVSYILFPTYKGTLTPNLYEYNVLMTQSLNIAA